MSEETIPCRLHCEAWWLWHGRLFAGNCFPNWKNTTRRETESAALSLFQRDILHDQQTEKCFIWKSSSSSRLAKLSWNIFQDLKRRGEGHSRYLSIRCNPFLLTQVVTDHVKLIKLQHIIFEQCSSINHIAWGSCATTSTLIMNQKVPTAPNVSNCGTSNGGRGCFPVGTELT